MTWVAYVIAGAILVGAALSATTVYILLPILKRAQFRQNAYEDAPETHQVKTGTPTMGGLAFLVALLPMAPFWRTPLVLPLMALVFGCALIGFVDDIMGIRAGRNMGLRARTKFLASALVAVVFLRWISVPLTDPAAPLNISFQAFLPMGFPIDVLLRIGSFELHAPHVVWLLLGICAIIGTIHAVNLTDGLDGLATGSAIPPLVALAVIGMMNPMGLQSPSLPALLGVGGCLGFLVFNRYPAKIFMGDTGSLALGALLAGIAILEGQMLLLLVICAVPVAETLSVIMQVSYFKLTKGKRIFKMTPLHHHFELLGWPETKVTRTFWAASLVASTVGLAIVR